MAYLKDTVFLVLNVCSDVFWTWSEINTKKLFNRNTFITVLFVSFSKQFSTQPKYELNEVKYYNTL